MAVRLSALRAGSPLLPGRFLVLISVINYRAFNINTVTLILSSEKKLKSVSSGNAANYPRVPYSSSNCPLHCHFVKSVPAIMAMCRED
jgi:hypothetical protein